MVSSLGDRLRRIGSDMRVAFAWLAFRKDTPAAWFRGSYSWIKIVRFSLVVLALLNFSAVALGSPDWNTATPYSLWLGFASAAYIIIAIVYFLGLRMWYGPVAAFLIISAILNYAFDSSGGPDALSPLNQPTFNNLIALSWVYLVLVGLALMRYDKGSRINEMLQQS
ncbi:MAG: hypothetical protein KGI00_04190 [Candidatus Micrarchaeota archaeon]|nr:hypothetical protein [Candidatus Micrarchaeota archaeon]MDE1824127.1 hypothetical protein [Candidatus Micrarchaeota archaeon]MDE1849900.1 hypothetical protein [Candidatus Micrarchaeota archaeon]